MIDVEICLEAIEKKGVPKWKVEVRSLEPLARALVEPLCDNDLATVPDLAPEARTWKGFLRSLSPNDAYRPPSITLRAVGRLIMRRILGDRVVAQHLDRIEVRAQERCEKLRILLEVFEGEDPILTRLPVELAHDGDRFFFKRSGMPSIRCDLSTEARNIQLVRGARVLIATAHADKEPQPDQASLLAHAEAVAAAVRGAGFAPEHLADATTSALHERLLMSPRVDILYLACHGIEDPDQMGQLVLRDKALPGEEFGRWLEEATEQKRAVKVVILCACSSAVPQVDEGTSGMAQWLVRPRRALAAIGFRGPVLVPWALRFSERIFEHFGRGAQLEQAFAAARTAEPDGEPQWVLPLCYGRRAEPEPVTGSELSSVELLAAAGAETLIELSRSATASTTPKHPVQAAPTVQLIEGETPEADKSVIARPAMHKILETVARLAQSKIPVLLHGETGVGKEVVARLIHESSARKSKAMVCVNCGALSPQLVESTLFGHEKGAFTDADKQQKGAFEEADGGTLFLDEIGELPLADQAALLRVLETRRLTRLGSSREIAIDVRVIAATHRDLETMCEAGVFRDDLYYRMSAMTLTIPPLRERAEEIEPLALRFLRQANENTHGEVRGIEPRALALLKQYRWPGNVRELKNAIESAVEVARTEMIREQDLPARVRSSAEAARRRPPSDPPDEGDADSERDRLTAFSPEFGVGSGPTFNVMRVRLRPPGHAPPSDDAGDLKAKLQRYESQLILDALQAAGWNTIEAAQQLGMPRSTLYNKIAWHKLERLRAESAPKTADETSPRWFRALPLPRTPRPYFTGRTGELSQLHVWARMPGSAQITAVAGEGGIGKTELAAKLAHEMRDQGRFVVWLERADQDPRGALGALIAITRPDFQAKPDATEADLAAVMRRDLGPLRGLLLLDDISDRSVVDRLNPGAGWNVLVTTRVHDLLPGVLGIDLRPLDPPEALRLLAQVAWNAELPPPEERAAAERLVERLGRLPLAIELAGATLRDLVTADEYLADLERGGGVAASDRARVHATMTRSLADLGPDDERVFLALGILPSAGATGEMVATTLGEPGPPVVRRLDRLVRHHLAAWSPEVGRYGLHPLLRDAAQERAKARAEVWQALHLGVARAIEELAQWFYAPVGTQTDLARKRWLGVRDIFDALNPEPWLDGTPGGEHVAVALCYADVYRTDRSLDEREALLATAEMLSRTGNKGKRAKVLKARGNLRRFRDDLDGAATDYDDALALYKAVESRIGQANVLKARGDLRIRRTDLDGAATDYDDALASYEAVEDRLGQANVLKARGDLHTRRADLDGAATDYDDALALYKAVESRLGKANVLLARGDLARRRGKLPEARRWYEEAGPMYREVQDAYGLGNVFAELARVHEMTGDKAAAEQAATEALRLALSSENRYAAQLAQSVLDWARQQADKT